MKLAAFLSTSLTALLMSGCFSAAPEPIANVDSAAVEHFTDGGRLWRKLAVPAKDDQAILERFFRIRPEWRDSTEIEGSPVAYAAGDERRFYWIRSAQEGVIWTCIHWEKNRLRASSGAGSLSSAAD